MRSELAIDFGAVLDAVNANEFFGGINPIENAVVADAELAESRQIFRHPHKSAMHHAGSVGGKPLNLALHARANGGVQRGKLDKFPKRMWRSADAPLRGHQAVFTGSSLVQ
jgi:hypothetical protein